MKLLLWLLMTLLTMTYGNAWVKTMSVMTMTPVNAITKTALRLQGPQ